MNRGLLASGLILLVAVATGLMGLCLSGASLLSVQTASMVPTFRPGDALVIEPATPHNLRPGEIISYRNPRNPNLTITHRLIAINPKTGWLTTAGDARHSADPSFPPYLLSGRATLLLPGLGRLLDWLRRPAGLTLLVYLPASLVVLAEARRLACAYARPFYSVRL